MQIHEFQEMMKRIYFHRDSRREVEKTYKWLMDEVEELGSAIKERKMKAIKDEFADVLAWLASLANVLQVDLETSAITKYNNKCPKCQKTPCQCPF